MTERERQPWEVLAKVEAAVTSEEVAAVRAKAAPAGVAGRTPDTAARGLTESEKRPDAPGAERPRLR